MATMCFQRAGDTYWERRSKAAGLKVMADLKRTSNPVKANALLKEAGEIFESLGKADSAAQCFFDSGEYKRAGMILTSVIFILPAFMPKWLFCFDDTSHGYTLNLNLHICCLS